VQLILSNRIIRRYFIEYIQINSVDTSDFLLIYFFLNASVYGFFQLLGSQPQFGQVFFCQSSPFASNQSNWVSQLGHGPPWVFHGAGIFKGLSDSNEKATAE
jgi:hypothetical protein